MSINDKLILIYSIMNIPLLFLLDFNPLSQDPEL